jgi:hypothetical protein
MRPVSCSWGNILMVALTTQTSSFGNKASISRFAPKIGPLAISASTLRCSSFLCCLPTALCLKVGTGQDSPWTSSSSGNNVSIARIAPKIDTFAILTRLRCNSFLYRLLAALYCSGVVVFVTFILMVPVARAPVRASPSVNQPADTNFDRG